MSRNEEEDFNTYFHDLGGRNSVLGTQAPDDGAHCTTDAGNAA